ncbi:MAG: T9SS type A sorting domain-containing protein [Bacteroidetes bacterium]|nr:T9SS type A sorting domain-containing protein [Bacteroidota bacterium]
MATRFFYQPGAQAILSHGWKPKAPNFYDASANTIAACLLARIIEYIPPPPPFGGYAAAPMAIPEVTGVVSKNVRNNNNIVTRNLMIEDAVAGNKPYPKQSLDLANAETIAHNFDIQLISERYINPHFSGDLSAVAYAVLRSPELYAHWVASGAQGHGFTAHPEDSSFVWGGSDEMRLQNVFMNAGDRFPATLEFVLRDSVPIPNFSFTIHLRQFISDMPADTPAYGNISFLLSVRDSGQTEGQRSLGIGRTQIPGQCFDIFPNPASSVVYIRRAEKGIQTDATIKLLGINGQLLRQEHLDKNAWMTSMNTKGLPPGVYVVRIEGQDGNSSRYKLILK